MYWIGIKYKKFDRTIFRVEYSEDLDIIKLIRDEILLNNDDVEVIGEYPINDKTVEQIKKWSCRHG